MNKGLTRRQFTASIPIAVVALTLTGCSGIGSDETEPDGVEDERQAEQAATPEVSETYEQGQTAEEVRYFSQSAPDNPSPYLSEGGWSYISIPEAGSQFVNFAVVLGCSDLVNCYVTMGLKVTALDASGAVLASQDFGVEFIAPGDVMPVAGIISVASEPSKLEYQLTAGAGSPPGNPYTISDLSVSNTSEIVGELDTHWTGEYTNNCGVDFPNGAYPVVVLRSSGNIVGGFSDQTQRTPIANGASSYFDIGQYNTSIPAHDSFDVWMVPSLM